MSEKKKSPSTALMRVGETVSAAVRTHLTACHAFGRAPLVMFLTTDGHGNLAIEHLEPEKIEDGGSYLIIQDREWKYVGILRDGLLDADPTQLPASRTRCHLYPAGQA